RASRPTIPSASGPASARPVAPGAMGGDRAGAVGGRGRAPHHGRGRALRGTDHRGDPRRVDVTPAWLVYHLLDSWFRGSWLPDTVTVVDRVWLLSLLTAAAAVTAWHYHAHGHAERLGGALAWARGWT